MESGTCKSKWDSNSLARLLPWLPQDRWGRTRLPAPSLVFTLNDLFPRWIPTTTSAMLPACLLGIVALLSHGTVTSPTLKRSLGCYEDENFESVPMESVARSSRPRTVSEPRKAARSRRRNRFRSGFERLAFFLWVLQDTYEAETFFQ